LLIPAQNMFVRIFRLVGGVNAQLTELQKSCFK